MCLFLLWTTALLFGSARLASAEEAPPAEDATVRADRLYRKGVEAYKAREYDQAREAFQAAYETKPAVEVLRNWGAAEVRAGRLVDGARHLARWLRATSGPSAPAGVSQEDRQAVEGLLHSAENQLSLLDIETSLAGADVKIDGETIGRAPLGFRVHVDAGQHVIEARSDTGSATMTITATPGSVLEVKLEPPSILQTPAVTVGHAASVESGLSMPALGSERAAPRAAQQGPSTWDVLLLASAGFGVAGSALTLGASFSADSQPMGSSAERRDRQLTNVGLVVTSAAALVFGTSVAAIGLFDASSSFTGVAGVSVEPHRAGLVMQGNF